MLVVAHIWLFSRTDGKILMYDIWAPEGRYYTLSTQIASYESKAVFA